MSVHAARSQVGRTTRGSVVSRALHGGLPSARIALKPCAFAVVRFVSSAFRAGLNRRSMLRVRHVQCPGQLKTVFCFFRTPDNGPFFFLRFHTTH